MPTPTIRNLQPHIMTPTSFPDIYRVTIPEHEDDIRRSYLTCFVFVRDGKLEVIYSHHSHHSRESGVGPWSEYSQTRLAITPITEAFIFTNVAMAFANTFMGNIRPITQEMYEKLVSKHDI